MLREYGHHIQNTAHSDLYGTAPPCDGTLVGDVATPKCAWVEGWSWFAAAAALGSPDLETEFDVVDIEAGTVSYQGDPAEGFGFGDETYSPGWVAAALWDAYDRTPGEAGDETVGNWADDVWEAFEAEPAETIEGWWEQWREGGDGDLQGIMELNHIVEPPIPPLPLLYNQTLFYDGFEAGLGNWTQAGGKWRAVMPAAGGQPPGAGASNAVAMARQCQPECALSMDAGAAVPERGGHIRFDRYVNSTLGGTEYLRAEAGGAEVGRWNGSGATAGSWHREEFPLPGGAGVSATFAAMMSSEGETVAVDNVEVIVLAPDTGPPVIELLENPVMINATGRTTRVNVTDYARVTDALDAMPSLRLDYPDTFPLGTTNVTWTATDRSGNEATAVQTFEVADVTPPVFGELAGIGPKEAEGPLTRVELVAPIAIDAVDGPVRATSNATSGLFPLGTTAVLWTAADRPGNSASAIQYVEVVDTTPPSIDLPQDIRDRKAEGSLTRVDIGTAVATDAVDGPVNATSNATSGLFPLGTTAVLWTATDLSGNVGSDVQRVTVVEWPGPVTIFSDGFEGTLDKWVEGGDGRWTISTPERHLVPYVPGSSAGNNVLHADWCVNECTIRLGDTIDLTGYSNATLTLWRFVDSNMIRGEYLQLQMHNGTGWRTESYWTAGWHGADNTWRSESYDLEQYLGSAEFNLQFNTSQALPFVDVQLDDILITGIPRP